MSTEKDYFLLSLWVYYRGDPSAEFFDDLYRAVGRADYGSGSTGRVSDISWKFKQVKPAVGRAKKALRVMRGHGVSGSAEVAALYEDSSGRVRVHRYFKERA